MSSDSDNNLKPILTTLCAILIITMLHVPVYHLLEFYSSDTSLAPAITFVSYVIVTTAYFTIFPLTKFPKDNGQTKEEN